MLSLPRAIATSSHVTAIRPAQLEAAEQRKLKRGLWLGVHTRPKAETGQCTVFTPAFCISHGPAGKIHDRVTAGAAANHGNQANYGLQHTRFGSHMP